MTMRAMEFPQVLLDALDAMLVLVAVLIYDNMLRNKQETLLGLSRYRVTEILPQILISQGYRI
ncbi:hypothetical protein FP026_07525 [Rhizobium tropici]|uniref:Uncharacterized protein n=1 Tax=Rhizobium tropici TaxID=398 RepID=A0A5B0WAD2_RHITR|nr:hypothetical protein [Rhizobium tropici]KAA1183866.1 hypothetical protein FP026_07525 [Rhizobium tropici]